MQDPRFRQYQPCDNCPYPMFQVGFRGGLYSVTSCNHALCPVIEEAQQYEREYQMDQFDKAERFVRDYLNREGGIFP